jgi:vitamin B12 transporter
MEKSIVRIYKNWLAKLCNLAALLILPGILFAQNDTTKKLKQVNISSSKAPTETIIPSQQITANDFDRFSAFNVADAIRDFSGVIIKDYGGIGGLKTVSVRGLGANHTAVTYDGVQINDAETGQVDLSKLNLNNVQSIALYNGQPPNICQPARSFASASVLAITTVKPDLSVDKPYQITAGLNAGSFGLLNPYLQWQQRISSNWSLIINGYTENANGQYNYLLNNGSLNTVQTRLGADIEAQQLDASLYWKNTDSSKFNLHINYYNSDRGLPGPVILYAIPEIGQRLWDEDFFTQAGYEHIWKDGLHLLLNSKFSQDFQHYFDPKYPNAAGLLNQHYNQREFYQSAVLAYHIIPNWEVSYATDLFLNNMDSDIPDFPFPTRVTLLNVLATNLVLGKTTLQASILDTHIHEAVRSGDATPNRNIYSPTIMASVKPFDNQNFQVRAFYKYIFRYPTFDDIYFGYIINSNLKPEYTNQYDLGFTYTKNLSGIFNYIALTTDFYYNNVLNKIVYSPLITGSAQNVGKVDITGVDASVKTEAKLGLDYKLLLSVNYSYQQALNITDPTSSEYLSQLPYIPLNTVALNAGITRGKIGVYYNQVVSSSRYYNNNNLSSDYLPEYSISDASIVYKGTLNHLPISVSAEVNNLFNTSYVIVQSYPMPGRSFRLSFKITI